MPLTLVQDHITQKDCCSRQGWTCEDEFKAFLRPHYRYLSQENLLGDFSSSISRILIGSNSWFITLVFLHARGWLAVAEDEGGSHFWAHHTITACEILPLFCSLEQHPILAQTVLSCLQVCWAGEPSKPLLTLDTTGFWILSSMGQKPNSCNTALFTKHLLTYVPKSSFSFYNYWRDPQVHFRL